MDYDKLKATKEPHERPFAFVQWKGTTVCADLHCVCGEHGHFDGDFFYFYRCKCGRVYEVGCYMKLHEVTDTAMITELAQDDRLCTSGG